MRQKSDKNPALACHQAYRVAIRLTIRTDAPHISQPLRYLTCIPAGTYASPPHDFLMTFISTALIAFAMATDAFAAALGKGMALHRPKFSEALRTGLIFGVIETMTPIVGWALGSLASDIMADWDHWIAFGLLSILGAIMIRNAIAPQDERPPRVARHSFWLLAATGFATSIDAMAVGVSLAFIDQNILVTAAAIGAATMFMATLGVMTGRLIGTIAGKWAELVGGVTLIGIGFTILHEHLTT